MLQVGNGDLTEAENRSHFALWCMMAAPLMAGNNLANMKPEVLKILTNKGAIAINQDPLGKQAYRAIDKGKEEVWVKPISNGEFAVCFLNRSAKSDWQVSFDWGELGFPDKFQIQDAWNDKPLGSTSNLLKATIRVHDVLLLRLSHKSEWHYHGSLSHEFIMKNGKGDVVQRMWRGVGLLYIYHNYIEGYP